MAARGDFRITNPTKIDMTLTITMSVEEWKMIKDRLRPSTTDADWHLDDVIGKLIDKAAKEFNFYEEVQR